MLDNAKTPSQKQAVEKMLWRQQTIDGEEPPEFERNREKARERSRKASADVKGEKRRSL